MPLRPPLPHPPPFVDYCTISMIPFSCSTTSKHMWCRAIPVFVGIWVDIVTRKVREVSTFELGRGMAGAAAAAVGTCSQAEAQSRREVQRQPCGRGRWPLENTKPVPMSPPVNSNSTQTHPHPHPQHQMALSPSPSARQGDFRYQKFRMVYFQV